jgi:hypothetical protein
MRILDLRTGGQATVTHGLLQADRVDALVSEQASEWVVATGLPDVLTVLVGDLPGVVRVRLLYRGNHRKAFVVVSNHDIDRDLKVAARLCQVRDIRPGEILDYDVVPEDREVLIPADAAVIGKA